MELNETHVLSLKYGEQTGYEAVFRAFFQQIVVFSNKIVDNIQDAEEIAQDTFLKLWKDHNKFDSALSIKKWLHITARNASLDVLKKRERQNGHVYTLAQIYRKFESDNILKAIIHAELVSEIENEIENLPDSCRKVFKLLIYEGMNPDEIAKELNIAVGTVYNHKRDALKKLRKAPFYKSLLLTIYILVYFYLNKYF